MLSNRIQALAESETIKMSQLSRSLASQGINVVNLSVGEPDFNTPKFVKEAGTLAIRENYSFYTPVSGYAELREAIANKLKHENNLTYSASQIVVSTGAKQALTNALLCLVNPGDEVIIPTPYWVTYSELVKLAGGKAIFVPSSIESGYKITPAQLQDAITPETRLFMFSSPCNPSGAVYSQDELAALAEVFEQHPEVYIVSDEIYEHINFVGSHYSLAAFSSIKDRVVVVNGFSKAFAMTGWRVGYTASSLPLAQAFDKLQGQTTSATCSIAQRAALAAYTNNKGPEAVKHMAEAYARRRELMFNHLSGISGLNVALPQGAFYFFPQVEAFFGKAYNGNTISNSADLSMYLLNTGHVSTVPGSAFGAEGYIRLSFALADNDIIEGCLRIKQALEQLQ